MIPKSEIEVMKKEACFFLWCDAQSGRESIYYEGRMSAICEILGVKRNRDEEYKLGEDLYNRSKRK